jgi:DNA (cytosine-5)-methyltransferase 1
VGLTLIDLFAGCGGLSLGFARSGFEPLWAVEADADAAATYAANFGACVHCGPIEQVVDVPVEADVIVGGPPCQGFSPLGKFFGHTNHQDLNRLWREFFRIVDIVQPVALVIENVPQFLSTSEGSGAVQAAQERGYHCVSAVLNARDYGVAQKRKRAFIIASTAGRPMMPDPENRVVTVRDAIGDLPLNPSGEDWHLARNPTDVSRERYRAVPHGGNRFDLMRTRPDITPPCWLKKRTGSTDVFGRLVWEKPAVTIRNEFFKPEKGRYLHPEADRPITHREAMRIQSFPDSFKWVGSRASVARQVGNAVPPELARHVALALRMHLDALGAVPDGKRGRLQEPGLEAGVTLP